MAYLWQAQSILLLHAILRIIKHVALRAAACFVAVCMVALTNESVQQPARLVLSLCACFVPVETRGVVVLNPGGGGGNSQIVGAIVWQ